MADYEERLLSVGIVVAACALGLSGAALSLGFFVFNARLRSNRVIKMSSPILNLFIACGGLLLSVCCVMYGVDYFMKDFTAAASAVCQTRVGLLAIGSTLLFAPMFLKAWRVHQLFKNAGKRRVVIRDSRLLLMTGALVVVDAVMVVVWMTTDPLLFRPVLLYTQMQSEVHTPSVPTMQPGSGFLSPIPTTSLTRIHTCTGVTAPSWLASFLLLKVALLCYGLFLSWRTRAVALPSLNDSRCILVSSLTTVTLGGAAVSASHVLQDRPDAGYACVLLCVWGSTVVSLCMAFVPKVRLWWRDPEAKGLRVSLSSTCSSNPLHPLHSLHPLQEELGHAEAENHVLKKALEEKDASIRQLQQHLSSAHKRLSHLAHNLDCIHDSGLDAGLSSSSAAASSASSASSGDSDHDDKHSPTSFSSCPSASFPSPADKEHSPPSFSSPPPSTSLPFSADLDLSPRTSFSPPASFPSLDHHHSSLQFSSPSTSSPSSPSVDQDHIPLLLSCFSHPTSSSSTFPVDRQPAQNSFIKGSSSSAHHTFTFPTNPEGRHLLPLSSSSSSHVSPSSTSSSPSSLPGDGQPRATFVVGSEPSSQSSCASTSASHCQHRTCRSMLETLSHSLDTPRRLSNDHPEEQVSGYSRGLSSSSSKHRPVSSSRSIMLEPPTQSSDTETQHRHGNNSPENQPSNSPGSLCSSSTHHRHSISSVLESPTQPPEIPRRHSNNSPENYASGSSRDLPPSSSHRHNSSGMLETTAQHPSETVRRQRDHHLLRQHRHQHQQQQQNEEHTHPQRRRSEGHTDPPLHTQHDNNDHHLLRQHQQQRQGHTHPHQRRSEGYTVPHPHPKHDNRDHQLRQQQQQQRRQGHPQPHQRRRSEGHTHPQPYHDDNDHQRRRQRRQRRRRRPSACESAVSLGSLERVAALRAAIARDLQSARSLSNVLSNSVSKELDGLHRRHCRKMRRRRSSSRGSEGLADSIVHSLGLDDTSDTHSYVTSCLTSSLPAQRHLSVLDNDALYPDPPSRHAAELTVMSERGVGVGVGIGVGNGVGVGSKRLYNKDVESVSHSCHRQRHDRGSVTSYGDVERSVDRNERRHDFDYHLSRSSRLEPRDIEPSSPSQDRVTSPDFQRLSQHGERTYRTELTPRDIEPASPCQDRATSPDFQRLSRHSERPYCAELTPRDEKPASLSVDQVEVSGCEPTSLCEEAVVKTPTARCARKPSEDHNSLRKISSSSSVKGRDEDHLRNSGYQSARQPADDHSKSSGIRRTSTSSTVRGRDEFSLLKHARNSKSWSNGEWGLSLSEGKALRGERGKGELSLIPNSRSSKSCSDTVGDLSSSDGKALRERVRGEGELSLIRGSSKLFSDTLGDLSSSDGKALHERVRGKGELSLIRDSRNSKSCSETLCDLSFSDGKALREVRGRDEISLLRNSRNSKSCSETLCDLSFSDGKALREVRGRDEISLLRNSRNVKSCSDDVHGLIPAEGKTVHSLQRGTGGGGGGRGGVGQEVFTVQTPQHPRFVQAGYAHTRALYTMLETFI